jgi:hypothetical protein
MPKARNPRWDKPRSSLRPKPPELLANIAWFLAHWREHKFVIAIAFVIVAAPSVYGLIVWFPKAAQGEYSHKKEDAKQPSENSSPALRVRFRDGSTGYVSFSFSFALDPEAAPRVYENYGDQNRAAADLKEAVEGAVFQTMARLTLDEANVNRDKIVASIIHLTKPAQQRTGHKIYQVNIKQIERAQ